MGTLVLRDVTVLSLDTTYDGRTTDVCIVGDRVVAVGDVASGGAWGAAEEVRANGATLVPLMDATALGRPPRPPGVAVPAPGSRADLALVAGHVTRHAALHQLVVPPSRLLLAVIDGQVVAERGEPLVDHRSHARAVGVGDPRWGTWVDRTGYLHQHLHPSGRYDETRAGRRNAFTGACWLYRDRIAYLDDSGFWAFGRFLGNELHHAGFVMDPDRPLEEETCRSTTR